MKEKKLKDSQRNSEFLDCQNNKNWFIIAFIILMNSITNSVFAQSSYNKIIHLNKIIKQKLVNDILVEKKNQHKWFATEYGIYDYQNNNLIFHQKSDELGLQDEHINTVYQYKENIYLGTYSNQVIQLTNGNQYRTIELLDSSKYPNKGSIDLHGEYLVNKILHNGNKFLAVLKDKGIVEFAPLDSIYKFYPIEKIRDLVIDQTNNYWVATSNGLYFGNNLSINLLQQDKTIQGEITKLGFINNKVSVANYNKLKSKIWIKEKKGWSKIKIEKSLEQNRIRDFIYIQSRLWIAARDIANVYKKNNIWNEWEIYNKKTTHHIYQSQMPLSLAIDKKNNIWVGTGDKGIYLIYTDTTGLKLDNLEPQKPILRANMTFQNKTIYFNQPIEIDDIYFEADSSRLLPYSQKILDELIEELKEKPTYGVTITGHSSKGKNIPLSQKSNAYYKNLSLRRANTIANYLRRKGLKNKIFPKGMGIDNPKISKNLEDERNRRVVIEILRYREQE